MEKKIGIITMHRIINYGSALQAYALQTVIQRLGYQCWIIDYIFPNNFFKKDRHKKLSLLAVLKSLKYRVLMKICYKHKLQLNLFNKFWKEHFHLTQTFATPKELYDNPPSFDLYITGSDQVWNPRHMKGDAMFFCDFVKNGAKRISYAASISSKDLPSKYKEVYAKYLEKYTSIGVREKSSVNIVSSLIHRDVTCVCDPTLLLKKEDYLQLAELSSINIDEPYILVYCLSYNFNPHPMLEKVVGLVMKERRLKVIYLLCNNLEGFRGKHSKTVSAAGPNEFLNLFKNASFVITSSFHGTIFSLLLEKQFVAISSKTDDRIGSLLDSLNLTDRLVTQMSEIKDFGVINYSNVHSKIEKIREDSLSFLEKSISKNI